ncbi:MAG: methyltransferase domain-containing protein [Gammaproteobacteria bacterium]|nr:methyltransferase domain-containing protein [Gammaproteobacteria bacterium]
MGAKKSISQFLRSRLSERSWSALERSVIRARRFAKIVAHPYGRFVKTPIKLHQNGSKVVRMLEIGPGPQRIEGYETVNVVWARHVDYVADASRKLPFRDATFRSIYASHVLEHTAWYRHEEVLKEWVRILAPGGNLDVWVPNGLKIAKSFVAAESGENTDFLEDAWWKFNPDKDPCVWANGRVFSYGDGTGRVGDPNWHLALFSERYLVHLLQRAGLEQIHRLSDEHVLGHNHGWINLGVRGVRP